MRSTVTVKTAKIGYIILSAVLCALGLLLAIVPGISIQILGYIGAVFLIAFGVVKLIGYFSKDLYSLAFQHDLAFGIFLIAIGVVIMVNPIWMAEFYCIVLGLYVLGDALFKIQTAIDARKFGLSSWWLIMILAIAAGTAGFCLILRPSESSQVLMAILGISLLAEGILNLIIALTAVKMARHQQSNIIDM